MNATANITKWYFHESEKNPTHYALELGRFQNYSISNLWFELYSIAILVDFGKYSQTDFFHDFDSEKLSQNCRFFDSSILIKINPAKKLVFLSFLSQKIKSYL